jgi:vitamin B12 transporter
MTAILKYGLIGLCLTGTGLSASAHSIKDTVVEMKTVPIERQPIGTEKGGKNIDNNNLKLDADYQTGKRVSDILGENTSVFIKNYGTGQLSSISINGSSASQTMILWNGIKINSPTLGQVDLSLFDMGTVDNIKVTNTATIQSLGGIVAFNNNPAFIHDSLVSSNVIRYGSFHTLNLSSNNSYTAGIFSGSTKINYIRSDNDFPFVNNTQIGVPIQRQTNAATALLSFLQQLDLRIRHYNVGIMFWVTDADRQLPPVMTEPASFAREWDKSYRSLAYLTGQKGAFSFSVKTSYLYDWLKYTDPIAAIDSRSSVQAFRNIVTGGYHYRDRLFINVSLTYDHEQAISTGFDGAKTRNISGVNLSATYHFWNISRVGISIKQELQEVRALPFSPGAFIAVCKIIKKHIVNATLSGARAYRIPSLNDLYWSQGGNASLRPEHAWNSSLNLDYNYMNLVKFNANAFYNYVTDWILWHPLQSGIWTADNVKRVLSRGMNLSIRIQNKTSLTDRGFVVAFYAGYSYTNTISMDAISANDNSQNKQLIYVPLHNFNTSLQVQYRRFYIRSIHSFTGLRYTTTDNTQSLPASYLTHLEAGKDFCFNNQQIGLSFRINNITDSQYQVVEGRPMPGRNYEMTVRLNLTK